MQPNFAIETAPTQDMPPGPKAVECRSPKPTRYDKDSPAATRDDDSHSSFKSTLRDARKSQEETCRPVRAEQGCKSPEEQGRSYRETDNEKCSARFGFDVNQAGNGEEPDQDAEQNETDLFDQLTTAGSGSVEGTVLELAGAEDIPLGGGSDEGSVHELAGAEGIILGGGSEEETVHEPAGAEGIILGAGLPVTVEMATSTTLTAGATPVSGGGDLNFPDIAGDLKSAGAGNDLSAPKPGLSDFANHVNLADGKTVQFSTGSDGTDTTGVQKSESANILNSSGAGDKSASEAVKSGDGLVQAEAQLATMEKLRAGGQLEGNKGTTAKQGTEGPIIEQASLSNQLQAGQSVLKKIPQDARPITPEEVPQTRSNEISYEKQGAARMNSELLQTRETDGKLDPAIAEEAGPKLAKVAAGSRDTAFMHQQQDQNFERLMEPANAAREKENTPGVWRAQTLDQIVNRAVYHLKNGQNSVRIDLKPEFLGQIRMQIVTVEHQVSVRITAELPVVKEMLDNNLQQLKADLQQQGLEVDEIEVSVSTNSQHNANNRKKRFDEIASIDTSADGENTIESEQAQNTISSSRLSDSAVDMFV